MSGEEIVAPHSILVAIDDSSHAQNALERAIEIAGGSGAWLTLMHVIEPIRTSPMASPYVAGLMAPESDEFAEELLQRAAAQVPEGIPVHLITRRGHAADEIVRRIEAAGHDLVLIGSRGYGPVRSALLGSVSRAVVHRSPVPVVVVHAECERSNQGARLHVRPALRVRHSE